MDTISPARMEKALTEKKIDDRLSALMELGKTLSLPEISEALYQKNLSG